MSTTEPWPGEWLRGVLGLCVLRVLAEGPTYGYAIATRLADLGLGAVKGGTLYPLLARLESAGHVTVEWRAGEGGPGRKYYLLTDAGRDELATEAARWARFAALTATFVADLAAGAAGLGAGDASGTTGTPPSTTAPSTTAPSTTAPSTTAPGTVPSRTVPSLERLS